LFLISASAINIQRGKKRVKIERSIYGKQLGILDYGLFELPEVRKMNDMRNGLKDQTERRYCQVEGELKEMTGILYNDPELESRGKAEKIAEQVQEKIRLGKEVNVPKKTR
jgi:uncharacterized protein YjbJ (UPF0337 family)